MILYCDTSALVKLYIAEQHSDSMRIALEKAEVVAASRIAWAELHAALARRAREMIEDEQAIDQARISFIQDWGHYLVVEVTQRIVEKAGEFAQVFALRAYDAVQLATAAHIQDQAEPELTFACFDKRLNQAAGILGMRTNTGGIQDAAPAES